METLLADWDRVAMVAGLQSCKPAIIDKSDVWAFTRPSGEGAKVVIGVKVAGLPQAYRLGILAHEAAHLARNHCKLPAAYFLGTRENDDSTAMFFYLLAIAIEIVQEREADEVAVTYLAELGVVNGSDVLQRAHEIVDAEDEATRR